MKYKISDLYISINGDSYKIGVVLGEENKPTSPFRTEYIPISQYEKGLKDFTYGKQHIHDCIYHSIGNYSTEGEPKPIDKKWIDEFVLMGYDVSKIKYYLKCGG